MGAREQRTDGRVREGGGCDFGDQRLLTVGLVTRRSAHAKFAIHEKLRTDLQARTLGTVSLPLAMVPLVKPNRGGVSSTRKEPPKRRYDITYRRWTDGVEVKNGSVWLSVWMTPLLPSSTFARRLCTAAYYGAGFLLAFMVYVLGGVLPGGRVQAAMALAPLPGFALFLEIPQLLAKALNMILALAVPGLNMTFGSIRFFPWFSDVKRTPASTAQDIAAIAAGAARRLCIRFEIDDFAIKNPPGNGEHSHENFVFASRVVLSISLDARIAHQVIDVGRAFIRGLWRGGKQEAKRGAASGEFSWTFVEMR